MKIIVILVTAALGLSTLNAFALDADSLKAMKMPESGSVDEARICAAVMSNTSFVVHNNGRPDAKKAQEIANAFTKISYMWVDIGAIRSNEDKEKYVIKTLSADMDALMAMGTEVNQAYFKYCMPLSETHIKKLEATKP